MVSARFKSVVFFAAIISSSLAPVTALTAHAQSKPTVFAVTEVDKKPEPKKTVKPDFPSSLRKRETPGEITLRFVVTPEGKVTDIVVVKFNDPDMIDAAYSAYEEAKFIPGEKGGQKVHTRIEVSEMYPQPKKKK